MLALRDTDYLAARLHGRRGRMAAGARLRALCALGSPAALAAALFPGAGISTAAGIQARLAEDFIAESLELRAFLPSAQAAFVEWQTARFQLENLKVIVRALAAGRNPAVAARLLIRLPEALGYGRELAAAKSAEDLPAILPAGIFRDSLERSCSSRPAAGAAFFYEAALDRDYLDELSARAAAAGGEDGRLAGGLCAQEAAAFNLALVARGRFFYGFKKEELADLFARVPGRGRCEKMLLAGGIGDLRSLAGGVAVEKGAPEPDPARLAAQAWRRYALLAGRAFRSSHIGFGAVAAYLAQRRVETADLATVSEGLRLGLTAAELLPRLTGTAYV